MEMLGPSGNAQTGGEVFGDNAQIGEGKCFANAQSKRCALTPPLVCITLFGGHALVKPGLAEPAIHYGWGQCLATPLYSALIPTLLWGGDTRHPLLFSVHCGPEGPAAGPKGPQRARRAREGERSEAVVPEATY